jgi:hypothetical protein
MNLILNSRGKKVNGKVPPVRALKTYRGSRNIAPLDEGQCLNSHSGHFSPGKINPYPLNMRLDEPQNPVWTFQRSFPFSYRESTPGPPDTIHWGV